MHWRSKSLPGFCDVRDFEATLEVEGRILASNLSIPKCSWGGMLFELSPYGGKNKTMNKRFSRFEFDSERECGSVIRGGHKKRGLKNDLLGERGFGRFWLCGSISHIDT